MFFEKQDVTVTPGARFYNAFFAQVIYIAVVASGASTLSITTLSNSDTQYNIQDGATYAECRYAQCC